MRELFNEDCLEGLTKINAGSIDMILADLPYGTTANKWDTIIPLDKLWKEFERVIKPTGNIVMTAAQPFTSLLVTSKPELFRYSLVWEKSRTCGFLNAKKQPLRKHEDILVFYKKRGAYNPQYSQGKPYKTVTPSECNKGNYGHFKTYTTISDGRRYPTSIWTFNNEVKTNHPTAKPVALLESLLKTYSNEGDLILDPTAGGGSTLVACDNTNRRFVGFEMDKEYFEAAQLRIAANRERLDRLPASVIVTPRGFPTRNQ